MAFKLIETDKVFSFLDIGPLSKGHALIIPKLPLSDHIELCTQCILMSLRYSDVDHAEKLHEVPDEYFADVLPAAKKIALALDAENYNLLQNNGRIAHQEVDHVHFHVIPKPAATDSEGLVVGWPAKKPSMDELKQLHAELVTKL
ncbi:LOW QUALITY PROTEIN: hypothetical protein ACG7TL_006030 [Trametes sanguinea]